ncbi:3531_t:CDS:2 [Paraglomus occultum]|uniref:3531_t:CDS:1 n=1 Tax=Paraglomus occultum TaxID=144539 RepID=A0A9N8ZYU0_9GLOM|nr:3531_t:CDS:2 [Paraglomus occultum]
MDTKYYARLAKEYLAGSDWTVRGYLDFVKSKHPDVSSADRQMVEGALKGKLRAISGKGKGNERSKALSVLGDFKKLLKSRAVASFWEERDKTHYEHSALTTIRQEGIQSSSGEVCCNNASSSKRRIEQDESDTRKRPALEDAEESDGFDQMRTPSPIPLSPTPLSLSSHSETFTSPKKPMLHKDALRYLHKHAKIVVNKQCVILRRTEGGQCAVMASVLHNWLLSVLLSEKEDFQQAIMTPLGPEASTSHNQFRRVCQIILGDFFSMTSEAILDRNIGERKYTVERIVPLFKAIQSVYKEYAFDWIEAEVKSIKDAKALFAEFDMTAHKADGIGMKLGSNKELIFVEVSGGPESMTEKHANDDTEKLIEEAIFGLVSLLWDYLDKSAKAARNVSTFMVQVIGDRITLSRLYLEGRYTYSLSQIKSATIPFCFDEVEKYLEVFELLYALVSALEEQARRLKGLKLTSFTDDAPTIREWVGIL